MWRKILISTLLGGFIVALWQAFSWTYLPWHCNTLNKFRNEAEVAYIIRQNAPKDGMYIIPSVRCHLRGMREEWDKIYIEQGKLAMTQGPVMFSAIALKGTHDIGIAPYIYELVFWSFFAFLITWLIYQTRDLSYWRRVIFISVVGLLGGLMGYYVLWNWEAFSTSFFLVHATDILVGWILAALAMAAVVPNRTYIPPPQNETNKEVL